jgi:hypothetical protein
MSEECKTDRRVKNEKEIRFDTTVNILLLLIENRGKSFMNKEIREKLFEHHTDTSVKSMVKRIVDLFVESYIFIKVMETTDSNGNVKEYKIIKNMVTKENGEKIEVQPNQIKVRLYDKDKDCVDENGNNYNDDYYVVDLNIPKSVEGRERFCVTVSSMIKEIPYVDIYSPTLRTVLESQLFGFQTDFISQIIGKVIVKHHNIQNKQNETNRYNLDVLMSIIKSNINVNVKFENFGNIIELKNTKIKRVSIKENGFDIHFDNFISQNQSDINQILSIENSSEDGLKDDIKKLSEMIKDIKDESIQKTIKEIITFENGLDVFEF